MRGTLTIAYLTWTEARRRRIILAAVLGGLVFLLVFAVGVNEISRSRSAGESVNLAQWRIQLQLFTQAGLYVVNFLAIAVAILLPVDTVSGEINSGVMQTLASKPIRRSQILLGKYFTYWLMTAAYLLLMAGGIVLIMRVLAGFEQPNMTRALPLMLLGATVMLTITMAGGVRLTTITNGLVAFAFYGVAFIGGWVESIGALSGNDQARQIGTAISLVSPSDAMWRRAAHELQPSIMQNLQMSPFAPGSTPTNTMIVWTIGFILVVLALALYQFQRRPL